MSGSPAASAGAANGKMRSMPADWLQARLGPDVVPVPGDAPGSLELLDRLHRDDRADLALMLAGNALPPREAVWWACMCARGAAFADPEAVDLAAVSAAERWVREPDRATWSAAYRAAKLARFRSAEAMAATGAFWTEAAQRIPMAEAAAETQRVASIERAVRTATLRVPAPQRPACIAGFLDSARDIAVGGAGRLDRGSSAA